MLFSCCILNWKKIIQNSGSFVFVRNNNTPSLFFCYPTGELVSYVCFCCWQTY